MSISGIESNGIGGGGFGGGVSPWGVGSYSGGGGGLGAIGLFGLIGLDGLRGKRGDDDCCESNRNLAVLAAIGNAKDATFAEGRSLQMAICDSEKTNLQQFFAAQVSQSNATQAVKDQATAYAIVADNRADAIERAGVIQTAAILAAIEANDKANLRDQLFLSRERCNSLEGKSDITQLGIAFGNQIQAANSNVVAVQNSVNQLANVCFGLADQVAKATNSVINVGNLGATTTGAQTANPTNVKA